MRFASEQLNVGDSDELDALVGSSLRKGSITAFILWIALLVGSYILAPSENLHLEDTERNASIIVLVLLVYTNGSRIINLIIRDDKRFLFVNSGAMVVSITVQVISISTCTIMLFFPTPIVVDPFTGIRSYVIRWVEWIPLSFLMTFLTESIDAPLQGNGRSKSAWLHGIALSVSTSAGLILPFCTSWNTWLVVFGISWTLFCSLFFRIYQRYSRLSKMSTGKTVEEKEEYDKARYGLKCTTICAVTWSGIAVTYSVIALFKPYAAPDSIFANESLAFCNECFWEIISKIWYANILFQLHNAVFDNTTRTMRRLEELRKFMTVVWQSSSDVMVWCTRRENLVIGVVSPSFFKIKQSEENADIQLGLKHKYFSTMVIEVNSDDGSYRVNNLNLSNTITRLEANTFMRSAEKFKSGTSTEGSSHEKNISIIAKLLCEVCESNMKEMTTMKELYSSSSSAKEIRLRCEAKITKIDETSCLIIVRDISERFQRFETEKKLIQEVTARNKDGEANRFTRHEIKNGILAAIGLIESMKEPSIQDEVDDNSSGIISLHSLANSNTGESNSDNSLSNRLKSSRIDDSRGELDSTLRHILDMITDHAMSRDVIHEVYELRKERVLVTELISNIRFQADSNSSNLSLRTEPNEFPTLIMDPRLLCYIFRNALSNACRYGKIDGKVQTLIVYDNNKRKFRMEVVNAPGNGHDSLLNFTQKEIEEKVFTKGASLHTNLMMDQELKVLHSSGDGAWIMRKCAKMLKGDCDLRFERNRTVFSFWCPSKLYSLPKKQQTESLDASRASQLPDNTWGIVIDDSSIQRKLMDRFLKFAGIQNDRRVIVGKDYKEIYGFPDLVVGLMRSNPGDKFLLIVDENLEVVEGASLHDMVSGSLCVKKILQALKPSESSRLLALIRSANDSAKDIEWYKANAHGYLTKAPIEKVGVLNSINACWIKRFPPSKESKSMPVRSNSDSSFESADYDPFYDIGTGLDIVDALFNSSSSSSRTRWQSIQEKLNILKGDMKTVISSSEGEDLIKAIDELRLNDCEVDTEEYWNALKIRIKTIIKKHK